MASWSYSLALPCFLNSKNFLPMSKAEAKAQEIFDDAFTQCTSMTLLGKDKEKFIKKIAQGLLDYASRDETETVSETISDFIANYTQFSKTNDAALERVVSVEHIETKLLPALRSRLGNQSTVSESKIQSTAKAIFDTLDQLGEDITDQALHDIESVLRECLTHQSVTQNNKTL